MNITASYIEAHIFRRTEDDIEFLLLKRSAYESYPGIWQPVTGAIMEGEKAFETAFREIIEETGIRPSKFWVSPNVNSFYAYDKDQVSLVPVFVAEFSNDTEVVLSAEHSEFCWLKKTDAKKILAWKGQRDSVETIDEYFTRYNSCLNFVEININNL